MRNNLNSKFLCLILLAILFCAASCGSNNQNSNTEKLAPQGDSYAINNSGADSYNNTVDTDTLASGETGIDTLSSALTVADRDIHGCLGSAGYVWSDVLLSCIRLWESGLALNDVDAAKQSASAKFGAYIIFSKDSSKVEFFNAYREPIIFERKENNLWDRGGEVLKKLTGKWVVYVDGKIKFVE